MSSAPAAAVALLGLGMMLMYKIRFELLALGQDTAANLKNKNIFQLSRASRGRPGLRLEAVLMWMLFILGICTFPFGVLQTIHFWFR